MLETEEVAVPATSYFDNSDAVEAMLVHLYFGPYYSANDTAKGNDWRFHVEVSRVGDKVRYNYSGKHIGAADCCSTWSTT